MGNSLQAPFFLATLLFQSHHVCDLQEEIFGKGRIRGLRQPSKKRLGLCEHVFLGPIPVSFIADEEDQTPTKPWHHVDYCAPAARGPRDLRAPQVYTSLC